VWDPRSYQDTDYGVEPGESFEPEDAWEADDEEVSAAGPHIMTVLGPIDPQDLGICLVHEHLLRQRTPATAKEPDHWLDNEELTSEEIEAFVAMGGRAIVDSSTGDYGRNTAGLMRLAMRAPVHIIGVTGRYIPADSSCPEDAVDVERLTAEFVADLIHGMGRTTARAGMLKIATVHGEITEVEEASIQAAAGAHLATGAPLMIRAGAGTMALEQLNLLLRAGMDLSRVIVGRLDQNLEWDHSMR
jgi:predicted metal-dependent phosphotriesterase family hydrolase